MWSSQGLWEGGIILVSPKCLHEFPYKREAEGDFIKMSETEAVWPEGQRLEGCSHRPRNADVTEAGRGKRQSPPCSLWRVQPCHTETSASANDLGIPTSGAVRERMLLFQAQKDMEDFIQSKDNARLYCTKLHDIDYKRQKHWEKGQSTVS